jgi:DtxR family Mn-dependent transcriptional regulator
MATKSTEDYLKCVFILSEEYDVVSPVLVAEYLDISSPAVTKMIRKLQDENFIRYIKKKGISLTAKGKKIALEIIRRHRLLELYLIKALGYTWDKVHEEAERLEHVISEEFEEKIDDWLGHPTHDPHGAPIPTKDGKLPEEHFVSLDELTVGEQAIIQRINKEDAELLRYIGSLGMYPGTSIVILSKEPFGGPIHIVVENKKQLIGKELALHICVKKRKEK